MDVSQILATGGASGVVCVIAYFAYRVCLAKRSRCSSNCSSGGDLASPTVAPAAEQKPTVVVV